MTQLAPFVPTHPNEYPVDPCPFCFGPAVIDTPFPHANPVSYILCVEHRATCPLELDASIIHFPYWTSRDYREIEARWNYRPKTKEEADTIFT